MLQGWILCYCRRNRRFGLCIPNDSSHRESCQKTMQHNKKSKKATAAPNPLHYVHSLEKNTFHYSQKIKWHQLMIKIFPMTMTHSCKLFSFFRFEPKANQAKLFESRQHNRAKYIFAQRRWFSKNTTFNGKLVDRYPGSKTEITRTKDFVNL